MHALMLTRTTYPDAMTQTEARPEAPHSPEPDGLASTWTDAPPARRALAVEQNPHFQATPVRLDEAFPEYEAYHSVIEPAPEVPAAPYVPPAQTWPAEPITAVPVEPYGWAPGSYQPQPPVAPGLAPYGMSPGAYQQAPIPAAYAMSADPSPYVGPTFDAPTDTALIAVGGGMMVVSLLVRLVPAIIVACLITYAATIFGGFVPIVAVFAWLAVPLALFKRRTQQTSITQLFRRI